MKRALVKFRNSKFRQFIRRYEKYAPIIFFICGFIFDTLTLGRIDRLYDLVVLCSHMTLLTITLYLFNISDDKRWNNSLIDRYKEYLPLAIQFFFGALSSAYVVYFSRSVSLSKTMSFFIILIVILFANELLKKRISNKYLQFSVYFFLSITFFTFIIPVFIKEISSTIFILSGLVSLIVTLSLIFITYSKSPSTRLELRLGKMVGIVLLLYTTINIFYYFNLIPPVPLALESGIVAHNIEVKNNKYIVTYETDGWYVFWRDHRLKFISKPKKPVYIFTSIFAPTHINKTILHRWKWYNKATNEWEIVEDISFSITGGRGNGYRGYTLKKNTKEGEWQVEVITEEELILGVIDFEIIYSNSLQPRGLVHKKY